MSIIGQQLAESKLREKYVMRAKKRELFGCIMGYHIAEKHHYQGDHGDFLKDSWPRRCKICGTLLQPNKWEPVDSDYKHVDCKHEPLGYIPDGKYKQVCKFPQQCKHCGIDLKPKTWKKLRE